MPRKNCQFNCIIHVSGFFDLVIDSPLRKENKYFVREPKKPSLRAILTQTPFFEEQTSQYIENAFSKVFSDFFRQSKNQ
jgi:hypothetical protein